MMGTETVIRTITGNFNGRWWGHIERNRWELEKRANDRQVQNKRVHDKNCNYCPKYSIQY